MLAKLNTLEDQLDAMTTKLDAATAKLDALTTKTHNIWETTHYTKGYLQGSIPELMDVQHVLDRQTGAGQLLRRPVPVRGALSLPVRNH